MSAGEAHPPDLPVGGRSWSIFISFFLALPVAAAGLRAFPLDEALESVLVAVAFALVALWPIAALSPRAERGLRAREVELALIAAGAVPALVLAWWFSRLDPSRARAAIGWLLLLGAGGAVALEGASRISIRRETAIAWLFGLSLGAPVLGALARDVGAGRLAAVSLLSPPSAVLAAARGESPFAPLAHVLALALLGLGARRPGGLSIAVATVAGVACIAIGHAPESRDASGARPALALEEARFLGGEPRARPALPAPLRLAARATAPFDGWLGVRAGPLIFAARAEAPAGGRLEVALAPVLPPEDPLLPVAGSDPAALAPLDPLGRAGPVALAPWVGLIGWAGEGADSVAREARRALPRAITTKLYPPDLDLLPSSAGVLDAVIAGRDVARAVPGPLARYAAAGGVVLIDDDAEAEKLAGALAAPPRRWPGAVERPLGGGALLAPDGADRRGVARRLAERLDGRRRLVPEALESAALEPAPPGPSRELGARVALGAVASALALALVLAAARGVPARSEGAAVAFAVASAVALIASGLAPRSRVHGDALEILEAPAGGAAAERVEVVRFAAPRREPASVELEPGGPPIPLDASDRASWATILGAVDGRAGLRFEASAAPRVFVRRDAVAIEPVTIATGATVAIENASPARRLVRAALISADGVRPIGDLEPGARASVDLARAPIDFLSYRRRAFAATSEDRARSALLEAFLSGRSLRGSILLVAFVEGEPPRPRAIAGLAAPAETRVRALVIEAAR